MLDLHTFYSSYILINQFTIICLPILKYHQYQYNFKISTEINKINKDKLKQSVLNDGFFFNSKYIE